MAHTHTRSHHKRLFPERSEGESLHSRWWEFGGRIVKDQRIALAFEREIVRQERLARAEGRVVEIPTVLNSLPWDSVPWYVRVPRRKTV